MGRWVREGRIGTVLADIQTPSLLHKVKKVDRKSVV